MSDGSYLHSDTKVLEDRLKERVPNSDPLSIRTTFGGPQRLHSAMNALATEEASCRANGITSAH